MEVKVAIGTVPKDGGTFTFYRNQGVAREVRTYRPLETKNRWKCVKFSNSESKLLNKAVNSLMCFKKCLY